jgi:hypothetical protein
VGTWVRSLLAMRYCSLEFGCGGERGFEGRLGTRHPGVIPVGGPGPLKSLCAPWDAGGASHLSMMRALGFVLPARHLNKGLSVDRRSG